METTERTQITIETTVNAPVEKAWKLWNHPLHIIQWATASPDWHTPVSTNDLRVGGNFTSRMEAKDGSFGFDFGGTYTEVVENEKIAYEMGDGRKATILFKSEREKTHITETFDAENENPVEMQRGGWQAILDNFKAHVDYTNRYEPVYFDIQIDAPKETVWQKLVGKESYDQWAGAAWPGSTYKGDWKEGSPVNFTDPEKSGTKARLVIYRENQNCLAEHIAILNKGEEETQSDMAKNWIGSREGYHVEEKDGVTTLSTVTCIAPDWKKMMTDSWPTALKKLKEISEA